MMVRRWACVPYHWGEMQWRMASKHYTRTGAQLQAERFMDVVIGDGWVFRIVDRRVETVAKGKPLGADR